MYNSPKKKLRRTLSTKEALARLFGNHRQRPCRYCGKKLNLANASFDHKVALSQGGYDKTKNGVIACLRCNTEKGSMSVEEFKAKLAVKE